MFILLVIDVYSVVIDVYSVSNGYYFEPDFGIIA